MTLQTNLTTLHPLDEALAELDSSRKKESVVKSPFPSEDERPTFVVLKDWVKTSSKKYPPGVYHCGFKTKGNDAEMTDIRICSYLSVEAVTFDSQGNNFGRLLYFKPTIGKLREWSMPMELLAGDGTALRAELLSMGVELDPENARKFLALYIQQEHPERNIRCVLQIGWCEDSFVLPDTVIGPNAKGVIYQSGERGHEEHTQSGTLEEWKSEIAYCALGNPLLTFAISAAFAGPLLALTNSEGGGFHFVGDSSTGKTTLIEAACSVWGGNTFKRTWRATANGMEGVAALFNDCLLALDEISQCDPREVGQIIYTLGNGRGKQRSSRSGIARGVTQWRCLVLSSGERSIETAMYEGGHKMKAGQSVRLLDVPVSQTYGAWDDFHDSLTAAAFSDKIKRAASKFFGKAGRAFLEKLTKDKTNFSAVLEQVKATEQFKTNSSDGQEKRAAARFALVAMAGELATEFGLTGWAMGDATKAAGLAYKQWQSTRGVGNDEGLKIIEQLSEFIQRYGDSKFSDIHDTSDYKVNDRAGWWSNDNGIRIFLFTPAGLQEALKGFDFKPCLKVLFAAGVLQTYANGEKSKTYTVNSQKMRLYPVASNKLNGAEDDA